jgi:hypothetical protein
MFKNSSGAVRAGFLAAIALGLTACGSGSPSVGRTVGPASEKATGGYKDEWQGNPATASNPSALPPENKACQVSEDPSCDVHRLEVPAGVEQVLVAIKADQASETPEGTVNSNDYDLYVYDDQNQLISYYGDTDGDESLVFDTTGSSYYEVRVAAYTVTPGTTYRGVATEVRSHPASDASDCLEAVPANVGVSGITDTGQAIELSIYLLLDGTSEAVARAVMEKAKLSYAPLNINLTIAGIESGNIKSTLSTDMIQETKDYFGGVPPAGADVVVTFTDQEMQSGAAAGTTVIGQADCIGGIRWPTHSFAVVTDVTGSEASEIAPGFNLNVDMGAETVAHEVGHLMGAHHHYGNCVEGNLQSGGPNDVSPCTLMFPLVNGASLIFGTFEGTTVRGHAAEYAAP